MRKEGQEEENRNTGRLSHGLPPGWDDRYIFRFLQSSNSCLAILTNGVKRKPKFRMRALSRPSQEPRVPSGAPKNEISRRFVTVLGGCDGPSTRSTLRRKPK